MFCCITAAAPGPETFVKQMAALRELLTLAPIRAIE